MFRCLSEIIMPNKDNNQEFLYHYNRLDNYLRKISSAPERVNMISYLEKILPEKQQSELKTVRQFKNAVESHGVNPCGKKPSVPHDWVLWLRRILCECKLNREKIADRLKKELNESGANHNTSSNKNISGNVKQENKRITKCDFCQHYDGVKCTNYSYYYGNTKIVTPSEHVKRFGDLRKNPCPQEAIDKYSSVVGARVSSLVAKRDSFSDTARSSRSMYSADKPDYNENSKNKSAVLSPRSKKTSRPNYTAALEDGNLKVKASLERGNGRYVKGLFVKKSYVNFKLSVSIQNENGLKISKVIAYIKGKNASMEKNISTALESLTEFDLPIETYGGNIEASVIIIYKIGLFKTKQVKVTVSKNF